MGDVDGRTGGTLFTEPVLVVDQRDKLVEVTNEYDIHDRDGGRLGTAVQIGQSRLVKAIRFLGTNDQFRTHRLEVRDRHGSPVLRLTRPAKLFRSRMVVQRPDDSLVGEIRQENVFGTIRFSFLVDRRRVGGITAKNWRARDFTVTDHLDVEVARISQTWEGLTRALFSTTDNYVVRIHQRQPEPLASMLLASVFIVDTALKQDHR